MLTYTTRPIRNRVAVHTDHAHSDNPPHEYVCLHIRPGISETAWPNIPTMRILIPHPRICMFTYTKRPITNRVALHTDHAHADNPSHEYVCLHIRPGLSETAWPNIPTMRILIPHPRICMFTYTNRPITNIVTGTHRPCAF